jgi:hypothetical protein
MVFMLNRTSEMHLFQGNHYAKSEMHYIGPLLPTHYIIFYVLIIHTRGC